MGDPPNHCLFTHKLLLLRTVSTVLLLHVFAVSLFSRPPAAFARSFSSIRAHKMSAAMSQDELKKLVGYKAVDDYVKSGMLVGLGTGSTVYFAVERLGQKLKSGELSNIAGIPTSERTREQAEKLGIPLVTLDERSDIDVAIDGADEVDGYLNLVKGRGGALLREKLVEECAKQFVCIVDQSKIQKQGLGTDGAMPVEVNKFCAKFVMEKIKQLPSIKHVSGLRAQLRTNQDGSLYVTDNGNYIVELFFSAPIPDVRQAARELNSVTGVVDHGLFLGMCNVCLVGNADGTVGVMTPDHRPLMASQ
eukprot:GDKI01048603.1.p1 GENE.GDKI01048603.1~~GDKI01048603.1.p1  ORF type:complete len:305 (-),score=87.39 GDKI01048603.1:322-1236(-)